MNSESSLDEMPRIRRESPRARRRLAPLLLAAVLASCGGCVALSGGGASSGGASILTRADLLETNMPSVYEAVQQIRPQWLRARGSPRIGEPAEVLVFVNDSPVGGVEVLRSWRSQDVQDVRFFTASEAATRYGTTAESGGLIVVRTRS